MTEYRGYKATIGLEIHAELKTNTKMFCASKNDPDEKRPNVNVCPVCMGHPGTLPVINKEAVKHVLKVGLAVGGTLGMKTHFDRKNYFYPDIPKGYQISQYDEPLVEGGELHGVALTRIHLEEDTGKSTHDTGDYSLVDFNRAGLPLMELVTEPVIHDAETAGNFARELQLLLRTIGAGEANMEKGEMRVEANISVSKTDELGTKVEVKNLNSFRSVERAIAYEIDRHIDALEAGEEIVQETRGWDENKNKTFSQRKKENSNDYRYFPDPDLPKLDLTKVFDLDELRKELPELPWVKRNRYVDNLGLKADLADVLVNDPVLNTLFETALPQDPTAEIIKLTANYITSDVLGHIKASGETPEIAVSRLEGSAFGQLIHMVHEGELSSRGAKDILKIILTEGGYPEIIARDRGLLQESNDEALIPIVDEIISREEKAVEEYKSGKEASIQYLVGQGMKETKGSAHPKKLLELFKKRLS